VFEHLIGVNLKKKKRKIKIFNKKNLFNRKNVSYILHF